MFYGLILMLAVLASPAMAQTYPQYDKFGNHVGNLVVENNRLVQRDVSGNKHGYWEKRNGYIEHRDNNGNLLDRTKD